MASTLKAKGYGDNNILSEFDNDYLFPRQQLPVTLKGFQYKTNNTNNNTNNNGISII